MRRLHKSGLHDDAVELERQVDALVERFLPLKGFTLDDLMAELVDVVTRLGELLEREKVAQ